MTDLTTGRVHRYDIDALRIVAAVMVLTIHVTSVFISIPERAGTQGIAYWMALPANLVSVSAVPVFFAISGWALMSRPRAADEAAWLGGRLARLVVPLGLWSLVYVGVYWVVAVSGGQHPETSSGWPLAWLARQGTIIAFGPGSAASLWFMYYLIALTLLLWAIQVAPHAIDDRRTRLPFFAVVLALILPYGLAAAVGATLAWAPFGWAVGYSVLGYVLISRDPPRRGVSLALYGSATLGLLVAEQLLGYQRWGLAYNGPLVFVQTVGVIGFIRSIEIRDRWRKPLAEAAKLTFGVYLVHLVLVHGCRITLGTSALPRPVVLVASWIIVVVCSFAVVALWHRSARLVRLLG